jgi:uncharacterized protein (UPF0248 family)
MKSISKYISNPDQKRIQEVFEYLPTGQLLRKKLNKITGRKVSTLGYYQAKIDGYIIPVHRLVYIYHHGKIPEGYHIDHIDHNRTNNRIENLRAIPARENLAKHMRSNYKGVYKTKNAQRWIAKVTITLGEYDTEKDALNAIKEYNMSESSNRIGKE